MKNWLKRLAESRFRISTRLFTVIGASVALTVAASLVGWFSIERVGNVQNRVNEGSVPALTIAFTAAQLSGELVAAAPRITAASPSDLAAISQDIDQTYADFDEQLVALEATATKPGQNQLVRGLGVTLRAQLDEIEMDRVSLFQLADRKATLQTELDELRAAIDAVIIPALDDQFFYLSTGYQQLGSNATPRSQYLSDQELRSYRFLAELQSNANISTQLLASAFALSEVAAIEPLRERFEAATGRIQRSISGLTNSDPAMAETLGASLRNSLN